MKFRRNLEHEKTFKFAVIFLLLSSAALLIAYLVTQNTTLLRSFVLGIVSSLLCAYSLHSARQSYIEFKKEEIIFVNHIGANITIKISDIEAVIMPSEKALKSKLKDHEIFSSNLPDAIQPHILR